MSPHSVDERIFLVEPAVLETATSLGRLPRNEEKRVGYLTLIPINVFLKHEDIEQTTEDCSRYTVHVYLHNRKLRQRVHVYM